MPNLKVYKDFKLYKWKHARGTLFKISVYDIHITMCSYSYFNAINEFCLVL